jgi:hypothetical protein
MVKIRVLESRNGLGHPGEIVEVTKERAKYWVDLGVAEYVQEEEKKTKK